MVSSSFEPVVTIHCLAALDLRAGVEQPFNYSISSPRTARPRSSWGGRWIGQRTTRSTVCSSAPHSQAAEEDIRHLCKQQRKSPTPMRRRLNSDPCCSWQDHSRRVDAGVGDERTDSRGVVQPLRIPSVIRPLRRTYAVVVR